MLHHQPKYLVNVCIISPHTVLSEQCISFQQLRSLKQALTNSMLMCPLTRKCIHLRPGLALI